MSRLTTTLANACNLRTLVVLFAFWLMLGATPPTWFSDLASDLDHLAFRLGLYSTKIAAPRTRITVVHVPVKEYESWLVDPLGATGLQEILAVFTDLQLEPKLNVGLVLEQPLHFNVSTAEVVLGEIQLKHQRTDRLYQDTKEFLERRERLLSQLRSKQVSIGLLDSLPKRAQLSEVQLTPFTQFPDWLTSLWGRGASVNDGLAAESEIPYLPILLNQAVAQYRVFRAVDGRQIPTFWSRLPLSARFEKSGEQSAQANFWHGLTRVNSLGISSVLSTFSDLVPSRADTSFIPIYGAMSGIHSSVRQITLAAASSASSFGDWVLIGKDGDARLEQVAQILASVSDDAILVQPWWWSAAQKYQILLSVLIMAFVVPWLSAWAGIGILLITLLGCLAIQILGQSIASLWLPSGLLLGFNLVSFFTLVLWRWQKGVMDAVVARADQASLVVARGLMAKGDLDRALQFALSCRSSPKMVEQVYQLGLRYEALGEREKVLNTLRELKRRKRNYKDANFRFKQIQNEIKMQRELNPLMDASAEKLTNEPVM